MLLHSSTGVSDREQYACVGNEDDGAWQQVAGDEEYSDVRAGDGILIGQFPVDTAGRAIGFRAVPSPVSEGGACKHERVGPRTPYQHATVLVAEPVTYRHTDIHIHIIKDTEYKFNRCV